MRRVFGEFAVVVDWVIPVVALIALATAVATVRNRRRTGRRWSATVGGGLMVAGLVLIALATLLPRPEAAFTGTSVNTEPFGSIQRYVRHGDRVLILRNLVLNVLLFVPFAVGAALRWRRVILVTLLGIVVSVAVEGLQWLLPLDRAVDIDDVLLNTLGALVGAVAVGLARWARGAAKPPAVTR